MTQNKKKLTDSLTETDLSEIIQMGLSDHVTFSEIESQYGLREDQVKKIMRKNIKPCLLYTSPSPRDRTRSRMPSSA